MGTQLNSGQWQDMKALIEALAAVLPELVERNTAPLHDRIEKLEAELKAKGPNLADAFRGAWTAGSTYARGSLVVQDGGMWLALADSDHKPGATEAWRLVTKKGKDGRDFRP